MFDDMLERVSRVLEEHFWREDHEGTDAGQRLYIHTAARLVFKEIREPSPAMLAAAHRNNHPRDIDTWRSMVDATGWDSIT